MNIHKTSINDFLTILLIYIPQEKKIFVDDTFIFMLSEFLLFTDLGRKKLPLLSCAIFPPKMKLSIKFLHNSQDMNTWSILETKKHVRTEQYLEWLLKKFYLNVI